MKKTIYFKRGDAFSREDLIYDVCDADVVITSGFYDWFEDKKLIEKSFNLIYECLSITKEGQ